jgi:DNA repair protein RecN (Recombination protein N)
VAAQADQQLRVSKSGNRKAVATRLEPLDAEGRVEELARMLGGLKVTAQTRAHAREMLTQSEA